MSPDERTKAQVAIDAAEELATRCKPLLRGEPPEIVGVALAELVSLWIGGHHPVLRDGVRTRWWGLVNELARHNDQPLEAFEKRPKEEPLQ